MPRHMGPTQQLYHDTQVTGVNRHKYFKRPLRQCLHRSMPPEVLFAPAKPTFCAARRGNDTANGTAGSKRVSIREPIEGELEDFVDITADEDLLGDAGNTRTFGTQTMYRESEAQTDPYTADYYVDEEGEVEPEVLSLTHLSYAAGTLPAGLPEIEAIERARARREFEKKLPQVSEGPHAMEQRRRMLRQQETEDLKRRENELAAMQNTRFEAVKAELRERERAIEDDHREKVERFARACAAELDRETTNIHGHRIKAHRRVLKERQALDASLAKRPSIIDKYADFGSMVYAPVAREGCRLGEKPRVANTLRATLAGLNDVESRFMHHFVVSPERLKAPRVVAKKYRSRKGQKLAAILDYTLSQFDEERRTALHAQKLQDGSNSTLLGGSGGTSGRSGSSARMRIMAEREEAQRAKFISEAISPLMNDIVDRAHRVAEFDSPMGGAITECQEAAPSEEELLDAEVARSVCETLTMLDVERQRATDLREIEEAFAQAERLRIQREAEESGRRQREGFEPKPEDYIDDGTAVDSGDVDDVGASEAREVGAALVNEDILPKAIGGGAEQVGEAVVNEDVLSQVIDQSTAAKVGESITNDEVVPQAVDQSEVEESENASSSS